MFSKLFVLALSLGIAFGAQAKAADYADSPEWLALLHYQKTFTGYRGTIASNNFYLSPCGRTNPKCELEETIALFQSNDYETQCLFPARYLRLKQAGLIDAPFPKCAEYDQFRADLRPAGITLLFTDAYMNNSSSLFGHTLLRIDTARRGTQLLAHGVNYGAYTRGYENSFLYAVYGLAGFYPAGLTTKPYYDIINTYNNIENRDIWEYNLNLTQEELALFVAHIWEIGQTTSPYYFFSQNCSYMLMEIFDAVRPSLRLAAEFPLQVIPLDTVKAVNARKGFVSSVKYRPSRQRKITNRIDQMSPDQYRAFLEVVKTNLQEENTTLTRLSDSQKADVLETAYQYVQYRYVAGNLPLEAYRKESFRLLSARNRYTSGQTFDDLQDGKNPVLAHDSAEISLASGWQNGNFFGQIGLRPAYHSINERPYGFLKGAEINFLDQVWRFMPDENRLVLNKFDILELRSLSPVTEVFRAPSYQIGLSVERENNLKADGSAMYDLRGSVGGGATWAASTEILVYAMSSLEGAYGGALPDNAWVGIGAMLGLLAQNDTAALKGELKQVLASARVGTQTTATLTSDYYLSQNLALEVSMQWKSNHIKTLDEIGIGLKKYF